MFKTDTVEVLDLNASDQQYFSFDVSTSTSVPFKVKLPFFLLNKKDVNIMIYSNQQKLQLH